MRPSALGEDFRQPVGCGSHRHRILRAILIDPIPQLCPEKSGPDTLSMKMALIRTALATTNTYAYEAPRRAHSIRR